MGLYYFDNSAWLIPPVPEQFKEIFYKHCSRKTVKKGVRFKIRDSFIYIKSGLFCQCFPSGELNKPQFMSLTAPGRAIGYMQFIGSVNHVEHARALRDSVIMTLPFTILEPYIRKDFDLHRLIIKYCSDCIESDIEGFLIIFTDNAESRLKVLIKAIFNAYGIELKQGWNKLPVRLTHKEYSQVIYTTLKTIDSTLPIWKKQSLYRSNSEGNWVHSKLFDGEAHEKIWLDDPAI